MSARADAGGGVRGRLRPPTSKLSASTRIACSATASHPLPLMATVRPCRQAALFTTSTTCSIRAPWPSCSLPSAVPHSLPSTSAPRTAQSTSHTLPGAASAAVEAACRRERIAGAAPQRASAAGTVSRACTHTLARAPRQ